MNRKTAKTVKVLLEVAYDKMKYAVSLCGGSINDGKRQAFDEICHEADCFMVEALDYMRKDNAVGAENKLYVRYQELIALRLKIWEYWQMLWREQQEISTLLATMA